MKKYLGIILGIGFLHRLLFLGARQLWTDELMQARIVGFNSLSAMLKGFREGIDLAAPLDFLVQKGTSLILGESAWALRLHAVVFGTLSIWIFYRIARFLFGRRVAIYSATLFTFFPLAYHYSQEARPYALLLFLTLLSYDLLLRQVFGANRNWRGWLFLGSVLTLLLYTSCLGFLILMTQGASLVLAATWKTGTGEPPQDGEGETPVPERTGVRWSQVAAYGVAALAAALLFYPWMRFVWVRPLVAPTSEIAVPKLILRLIKELGDNSYPAAGLLLIGMAAGIRAMFRHGRGRILQWLLIWFLLPIPVLLLTEIWAGYFFAIRHVLHATPPILLIAGYGLSYVGERLTILPRLPYQLSSPALGYAGLLLLACVWIGQSHARSEPADWRGTAAFLNNTLRQGDVVTMPQVYTLLEYYDPGLESFRVADLDPGPGVLASGDVQRRIVACYDKMWPDPCSRFRAVALKDPAWGKRQFTGFTLFLRAK
jgi:mannosyltransferase